MDARQEKRAARRSLLGRLRWPAIWAAVLLWIAGLAFDLGGNFVHLLLLVAILLLVHDLITEEGVRKIVGD
jgi:hypothetical protein